MTDNANWKPSLPGPLKVDPDQAADEPEVPDDEDMQAAWKQFFAWEEANRPADGGVPLPK